MWGERRVWRRGGALDRCSGLNGGREWIGGGPRETAGRPRSSRGERVGSSTALPSILMFHASLLTLALVRSLIEPAAACTCADSAAGGWLMYPADGDEVAADAVMFWRGPQADATLTLVGPEGGVPLDIEWWVSGTGTDVAVLRPQQRLAASASYEFSDSVTSTTFATSSGGDAPAAVRADLGSVCVDVSSEYDGDCVGTEFTLDLPPLDSGFYVAELTDEAANTYRVLGDGDGVHPFGGMCTSTFPGWETASVRAAAVSLAGNLGEWSTTFGGDMPEGGSECLTVPAGPDCGCATSREGAAPSLFAVAIVAVARRRRTRILARYYGLPRLVRAARVQA